MNPETLAHLPGKNENYRAGKKYGFTLKDLETFKAVKHEMSIPHLIVVEKDDPVLLITQKPWNFTKGMDGILNLNEFHIGLCFGMKLYQKF